MNLNLHKNARTTPQWPRTAAVKRGASAGIKLMQWRCSTVPVVPMRQRRSTLPMRRRPIHRGWSGRVPTSPVIQ
ncbi:MAG: hypothetical protein KA142_01375 [Chromatiaceae bacterium]|nr:hypothetical protein [Chromatiaceae bacterium]